MTDSATDRADADVAVALKLLSTNDGRRLCELSVFPENEAVNRALVCSLWERTGALGVAAGERLCTDIEDLSLLVRDGERVRLRSGVRGVLRSRLGEDETVRVATELARLVVDPAWLIGRIRSQGTAAAEADVTTVDSPRARAIAAELARSAHVLDWARGWELGREPQSRALTGPVDLVASELSNRLRDVLPTVPVSAPTRLVGSVPRLATRPRRTIAVRRHYDGGFGIANRLVGHGFGTVTIWDVWTGRVVLDVSDGASPVSVAADGTTVTFIHNGAIRVVDTATGRSRYRRHDGGRFPVATTDPMPDGTDAGRFGTVFAVGDGWLATTEGYGGALRVWEPPVEWPAATADAAFEPVPEPPGHAEYGWTAARERVGDDTVVRLRDGDSGELLDERSFYGSVTRLVPDRHGAWLALQGMHATQHGRTLLLWRVDRDATGRAGFGEGLRIDGPSRVAADADGTRLAVDESSRVLSVWDTVGLDRIAATRIDGEITALDWPTAASGPRVAVAGFAEPVPFRLEP